MFYKAKKVESFTLAMLATYRNASKNTTKANQLIPKAEALFHMIYYEACLNEEDAKARETYLKSGMGKRYLKK